jgi:hypothetical protein
MSWDRIVEKFHRLSEQSADASLGDELIHVVQGLDAKPIPRAARLTCSRDRRGIPMITRRGWESYFHPPQKRTWPEREFSSVHFWSLAVFLPSIFQTMVVPIWMCTNFQSGAFSHRSSVDDPNYLRQQRRSLDSRATFGLNRSELFAQQGQSSSTKP